MSISSTVFAIIVLLTGSVTLHSQLTAPPVPEAPASEGTVLHIHVSSVLVPVVVRDAQGRAVGDLKQEDFKVFDQGKRRSIIGFSLQQSATSEGAQPAVQGSASEPSRTASTSDAPPVAQPPAAANRFIVFLFDDRHLGPGNLEQAKKAGIRMLEQPLADGDRAVVLSFLGVNSGMTHDRVPLQAAIAKLKPRQINQHDHGQCPDIDYYTADQILNKHSKSEWDIAYEQAANCAHKSLAASPANGTGYVEQMVRTAAEQSLMVGDQDVRESLTYVEDVIRSMSKLPGQRTLILVSPGFFTGTDEGMNLHSQVVNVAAASNVTINTLDAGGLGGGNVGANQSTAGSVYANITGQPGGNQLESMRENQDVMSELADGTGGTYFHDSNNLEGGLKTLAAGPEYLYLLEFSLQGVKLNGSYHPLKVEVSKSGLTLQARKGYFAPQPPKKK
jgi:VWFA-related protein